MGRTIPYRPNKLKTTDMDDVDFNAFQDAYTDRMRRITEMVENRNKVKKSTYARRTTCAPPPTTPQRTCQVTSAYDPYSPTVSQQQQVFRETPQPSRQEVEIDRLTTENLKLKRDYAELLKKTTTLVGAYKKLEAANNVLTAKKVKIDAKKKTVEDTKKVFKSIGERFMTWLKT